MTRILFEIEVSRGRILRPVTYMRLAKSKEDVEFEFRDQQVTRITPIKTISLGKAEVKR